LLPACQLEAAGEAVDELGNALEAVGRPACVHDAKYGIAAVLESKPTNDTGTCATDSATSSSAG
jgi:hypothetical protein